jgi:hypothetical protein
MKKYGLIKIVTGYSIAFIFIVAAAYNFSIHGKLANILFYTGLIDIILLTLWLAIYVRKCTHYFSIIR